jgi:hypothetical protein
METPQAAPGQEAAIAASSRVGSTFDVAKQQVRKCHRMRRYVEYEYRVWNRYCRVGTIAPHLVLK